MSPSKEGEDLFLYLVVSTTAVSNSPEGDTLNYGVQLKFPMTNNKTEYEAILTGLRIAQALGVKATLLKSDSQLVIRQVKEDFEAKQARMKRYLKLTN